MWRAMGARGTSSLRVLGLLDVRLGQCCVLGGDGYSWRLWIVPRTPIARHTASGFGRRGSGSFFWVVEREIEKRVAILATLFSISLSTRAPFDRVLLTSWG